LSNISVLMTSFDAPTNLFICSTYLGGKFSPFGSLERFLSSLNSQYSYQISYLNFYTIEKKCTKNTEEIFSKLSNRPIRKISDNNYLTRYTELCHPNQYQFTK
ncbi:MAG: hypothetical protein AAB569_00925, partial [Patescibacteria group bacterium]